jgi:hypothetical protein
MGYTHGKRWTDEKVEKEVKKVMVALNINRFPTRSEMELVTRNHGLSVKISKSGGFKEWAKKLNLPLKESETQLGQEYEEIIRNIIKKETGYIFELTNTKHPYDLYLDGVKIDVKVSNRHYPEKNYYYYTFNLEKIPPTCDIYVCLCKNKSHIDKILVIPSTEIDAINQLSIGKESKYDKYKDRFDYIEEYYNFYNKRELIK